MGDRIMTEAEIAALDRRNTVAHKYVMAELKEIKSSSKNTEKAVMELGGEMKEVNAHLSRINGSIGQHEINFVDLKILLRGEERDKKDAGMVGEHIEMRKYIFNDLRPSINKIRWWFVSSMLAVLVFGALAGYVVLKP